MQPVRGQRDNSPGPAVACSPRENASAAHHVRVHCVTPPGAASPAHLLLEIARDRARSREIPILLLEEELRRRLRVVEERVDLLDVLLRDGLAPVVLYEHLRSRSAKGEPSSNDLLLLPLLLLLLRVGSTLAGVSSCTA